MENKNKPIYPAYHANGQLFNGNDEYVNQEKGHPLLIGLTKREYFAGLAMQGLLNREGDLAEGTISKLAVIQADALLAALEEEK